MTLSKKWAAAALVIGLLRATAGAYAQGAPAIDSSVLLEARKTLLANPLKAESHDAYFKAFYKFRSQNSLKSSVATLVPEYEGLAKKYPDAYIIPFAIGSALERGEDPGARPWLERSLRLNESYAPTYMALWGDAQRWGRFEEGQQYLEKAASLDRKSPEIAFYYANSLGTRDKGKYRTLIFDMVKRFPDNERAAQALYWYAYDSKVDAEKVSTWELLLKQFPAEKFDWAAYGAGNYFDHIATADPGKALQLATSMSKLDLGDYHNENWALLLKAAGKLANAGKLAAAGKHTDVLKELNEIRLPRYSGIREGLMILKADALSGVGNNQAAYDSLAAFYAKEPSDRLWKDLAGKGMAIGKTETAVLADVKQRRYAVAKEATPFTLQAYATGKPVSLGDFKGKVVLLTYWFPGCGPCRREFPHFEKGISRFKGSAFAFIGINTVQEQDEYVLPFLQNSGYSFMALRDEKGRKKGNLDNRNIAPMNFIIDKQGKIVFSGFMIGGENEDMLERMIAESM